MLNGENNDSVIQNDFDASSVIQIDDLVDYSALQNEFDASSVILNEFDASIATQNEFDASIATQNEFDASIATQNDDISDVSVMQNNSNERSVMQNDTNASSAMQKDLNKSSLIQNDCIEIVMENYFNPTSVIQSLDIPKTGLNADLDNSMTPHILDQVYLDRVPYFSYLAKSTL